MMMPKGKGRPRPLMMPMRLKKNKIPVLVGLYEEPERPPNSVDYIKRYLGVPTGLDIDSVKAENEQLKTQVEELRSKLMNLETSAQADE